jgi:multiple antibiotic resistance protein
MSGLHDFLLIFIPLFVVIDPAGTIPIFLALTGGYAEKQRRRIAVRATVVAGVTGIIFVILGQSIFTFLGVRFADFQIAGGILLALLSILDLLSPGKPSVSEEIHPENPPPPAAVGVVPLAVPIMVGPATMTTSLLLVNTYAEPYNRHFGAPYGQIIISVMVCAALLLNLVVQLGAMWHSNLLVRLVGKNTMTVINKIVMILLAAIAVSLIRQGVVSIVSELRIPPVLPGH